MNALPVPGSTGLPTNLGGGQAGIPAPQPALTRPPITGFPGPVQNPGSGTMTITPGDLLRRAMGGLTPRSYAQMLPSTRDMLTGGISALGVDPRDWFASLERSFPTGPNPAASLYSNY